MSTLEALREIYNGMYNKQGFVKEFMAIEQALKERDMYFQALCDIEKGEDVRKVLERTLT